jgi:hypothetical protein
MTTAAFDTVHKKKLESIYRFVFLHESGNWNQLPYPQEDNHCRIVLPDVCSLIQF